MNRLVAAFVAIGSLLGAMSVGAEAKIVPGVYSGRTSQGRTITLRVSKTRLTQITVTVDQGCVLRDDNSTWPSPSEATIPQTRSFPHGGFATLSQSGSFNESGTLGPSGNDNGPRAATFAGHVTTKTIKGNLRYRTTQWYEYGYQPDPNYPPPYTKWRLCDSFWQSFNLKYKHS